MIKTYVIDTNVLIQAPYALECFDDNRLVLPLVVLEELDGLKKAEGERGANARKAIRNLERYRQCGDLLQGVELPGGGSLRIEKNFVQVELPQDLPEDKADNRILKVCKGLADADKNDQIILVSKDIVLRLKAQILGIPAEDFEKERISDNDAQYTGRIEVYIPEDKVKEFKKKGICLADAYQSDPEGKQISPEFHENEFVILKPDQSVKKTLLGRVSGGKIVPLVYKKSKPYGVSPRNVGQYFMQEALMTSAEEAPLVILKGMAGTMGYKRMQNLTHDMENVFSEVRNGNIKVKPEMIDVLFQCLDALEEYKNNIQETSDEGTNDNENLIKALNDILNDGKTEEAPAAKEEAPTATAPAAESGADGGEKWNDIAFDDSQIRVIKEAMKQGKNVYGINVVVQESCILKAARAFLVFKAVEEKGEIIVSMPSAQDVEDEKFDKDFTLIVLSDYSLDDIIKSAESVSEIAQVTGAVLELEKTKNYHAEEEAIEPAEEKKEAVAEVKAAEQPKKEEKKPVAAAKAPEKKPANKPVVNRTVRVDIEKLDSLMNLVSELIIAKNSLVAASSNDQGNNSAFNEQIEYLENVTTNLHESVMKVRMVPIESVVVKFPRMIRDLSKKLDKKMELYMSGEETELDRTVVDEIGDPLMHLLRNSADHGLESAEVRAQRGKPEQGSIFLDAYQDGNNVVIEVRDDGNGIDVEAVKNKAIERNLVTTEQAANMSEKDIINLLFQPGFSTSEKVTDVSGRGVGLDVVKSKIESLSGEVEVKSKWGEGSTWTIRLPLTLAIIQALMVVVGGEKYAISLGSIQTIEDISPNDIKLVENKEVINLRGTVIPLIRLTEVLDVESTRSPEDNLIVVIVKKGDKMAGLVIDELIGQQEIVIKSLGKYIKQCKFISGATILGDGEVALILDANALL